MIWSQVLLLIGFARGFLSLNVSRGNEPQLQQQQQQQQQQCNYLDTSDFLTCTGSERMTDYARLKKMIRVDKKMNASTLESLFDKCATPSPCKKIYQAGKRKSKGPARSGMSSTITFRPWELSIVLVR